MKKLTGLFLCLFITASVYSQQQASFADSSFYYTTPGEMNDMANKILEAAGKKSNFKLIGANVPNAMAVVHKGKRYIFYNPQFFDKIKRTTGSSWAAISIMAHEIGHHLYENSANKGKSALATELEADEFSGYVLQKMGASLIETKTAIMALGNENATVTHPARDERIRFIQLGWINAGGIVEKDLAGSVEETEIELNY